MNKLKFIPLPFRISYFKRAADLLFNPLGKKYCFGILPGTPPLYFPLSVAGTDWNSKHGGYPCLVLISFSLFL